MKESLSMRATFVCVAVAIGVVLMSTAVSTHHAFSA